MIEYKKGNIFDGDYFALVNPVNCVGVMGAGLALEFKKRFPSNFKSYAIHCKLGHLKAGETFNHYTEDDILIVNAATKNNWKEKKSRIGDVRNCLLEIRIIISLSLIRSIAIPALGCGLGGLAWREVKPLFDDILGDIENCRITVYEPE